MQGYIDLLSDDVWVTETTCLGNWNRKFQLPKQEVSDTQTTALRCGTRQQEFWLSGGIELCVLLPPTAKDSHSELGERCVAEGSATQPINAPTQVSNKAGVTTKLTTGRGVV